MNIKTIENKMKKLGFEKGIFNIHYDNSLCEKGIFNIHYDNSLCYSFFNNREENVSVEFYGNYKLSKIYFYVVKICYLEPKRCYALQDFINLKKEINELIAQITKTRILMVENFEELYDATEEECFEYAVERYGNLIDEEERGE